MSLSEVMAMPSREFVAWTQFMAIRDERPKKPEKPATPAHSDDPFENELIQKLGVPPVGHRR